MVEPNQKVKFPLVKPLPHKKFDPNAMKVYQRLLAFHYQSYFVGGCIRDMLLGRPPKDFDIATAAKPRQIKRIFRNSRIIGRRFLVVNVFFGSHQNIEVTTFRRTPWQNGIPENSDSLLLDSDNVFGTDEEDALRRDFTINALFYDAKERTVIDYVDGLEDLQMGLIRTIGDPEVRFGEDPIRIIRALKFKAMLNFDLVPQTRQALGKCVHKLAQSSTSRLLLEMQKILHCGGSLLTFQSLAEAGIFSIIAPDIHRLWFAKNNPASQILKTSLQGLDNSSKKRREDISEAAAMASICFPIVFFSQKDKKEIPSETYCKDQLSKIVKNLNISKNLLDKVTKIIQNQFYLEQMSTSNNNKSMKFPEEENADCLEYFSLRFWNDPKQQEVYQSWKKQYSQPKKQPCIVLPKSKKKQVAMK